MGVKTLWPLLADVGVTSSLSELHGKTLAVDLSGWIVEGEQGGQQKIDKPHLKTVLWRICALLQKGIRVLVVADGKLCPALKEQELSRRQEMRDKVRSKQGFFTPTRSGKPKKAVVMSPPDVNGKRVQSIERGGGAGSSTQFQRMIDECLELLRLLGVPYIVSEGEAEATCALLNQQQVVSGVITNDSDAFLFGATTVYKNMTANSKKVDQIERFDMEDILTQLNLDRSKLLALAALLGCDYYPGVPGVGKEKASLFLKNFTEGDAKERLLQWKNDPDKFDQLEESLPKKQGHCQNCKHIGSTSAHRQRGCLTCRTDKRCTPPSEDSHVDCTCVWHRNPAIRAQEAELFIRNLTLLRQDFPPIEVFAIFQHIPEDQSSLPTEVKWLKPDFDKLKELLRKSLYFKEDRANGLILTLLTAYTLADWKLDDDQESMLEPIRIVKKKQQNFQAMYEIEWKKKGQNGEETAGTTLEPVARVGERYPALVQEYEWQRTPGASAKKGKKPVEVDSAQKKMTEMFRTIKNSPATPTGAHKATTANGATNAVQSQPVTRTPRMKKQLFSSPARASTTNTSDTPGAEEDDFIPIASTSQACRQDGFLPIASTSQACRQDGFLPIASTLQASRQSRSIEKSASGLVQRKDSWSSSTDRSRSSSHSRSGATPTHSRSRSRSATPKQPLHTPFDLPKFRDMSDFEQKVLKINKRTKFRKRIDVNGNWPPMSCKKQLFPGTPQRNVGQGDGDMLNDSFEAHFTPILSFDDEAEDRAQRGPVVGSRKRESSPMPSSSFYSTPQSSRVNSRANSQANPAANSPTVTTPQKKRQRMARSLVMKVENDTEDKEVLAREDTSAHLNAPTVSTPNKQQTVSGSLAGQEDKDTKSTDQACSSDSGVHSSSSKSARKITPCSDSLSKKSPKSTDQACSSSNGVPSSSNIGAHASSSGAHASSSNGAHASSSGAHASSSNGAVSSSNSGTPSSSNSGAGASSSKSAGKKTPSSGKGRKSKGLKRLIMLENPKTPSIKKYLKSTHSEKK